MQLTHQVSSGGRTRIDPTPRARAARAIQLQRLGRNGFGLRDPETGAALRWDEDLAVEFGAFVVKVSGLATRRDPARLDASAPGRVLRLVPEGRSVVVLDETGTLDIGHIADATAGAIAVALKRGVALEALALWDVRALDGSRTDLRVLIVPQDLTVTVA